MGTGKLTGPVTGLAATTKPLARCSYPGVSGFTINVQGQAAAPGVAMLLYVSKSSVTVQLNSGSGTTTSQRSFRGTGVSGFDATRGVQIDSKLTEISAIGTTPGAIGTVTSVKATIQCNGQPPGSSTLAIAGNTPDGPIKGGVSPVRVECFTETSTEGASLVGIVTVGSTKEFIGINAQPTGLTVTLSSPSGTNYVYTSEGTGSAYPTSTGVHINALVNQTVPVTPNTLTIGGDASCGTIVHL